MSKGHRTPRVDKLRLPSGRPEEQAIRAAAAAVFSADFLLIAAGAGFSADSGLPVYADVVAHPAYAERGLDYSDLCRPELLLQDPALFYGFWGDCLARYRSTRSHSGYQLLEKWISSKPAGNAYVYTSNVDGHFRRWPHLRHNLHEVHGCLEEWMCSSSMGYTYDPESGMLEREGAIWERHRDEMRQRRARRSCMANLSPETTPTAEETSCVHSGIAPWRAPDSFSFDVDSRTMLARLSTEVEEPTSPSRGENSNTLGADWLSRPPRCVSCGEALRPAVLLFNDLDGALVHHLHEAGDCYQAWEERMELAAEGGAKLVIIELGCGTRVPSVRQECEEVLRDTLARGGDATHIRVNPDLQDTRERPDRTIVVAESALSALQRIERAMQDLM